MLVLMAHGSRHPGWRGSVEDMMARVRADAAPEPVRLAYMEHASPTLAEVVDEAHAMGVAEVRVLPIFLAHQGHVRRDVEPLVQAARSRHPDVRVTLLEPFGQDPRFRAAIVGIALDTARFQATSPSSFPARASNANGAAPARVALPEAAAAPAGERRPPRPETPGTVYLVGAGPGDPELLTLRGAACLAQADVVLYDYLVNPAVLEHAPPTAELVALGRRITGRGLTPTAIEDRMVAEALAGRTVVRLKGGDCSVFARGADEETALRAAGVPFEVVPGITAGLAVGAYCEIPLTQHEDASAVALVTGHERNAKTASHLDYAALARFPGTLVLYMGVTRAEEWSQGLMAHGKPADTPVAIVRWCTRAEQLRVHCTLGTVVEVIAEREIQPPAIVVVGSVVDRAPERSWFESRPLFGTRVLVPGFPAGSKTLRDALTRLGADAVVQPALRVTPAPEPAALDAALERLGRYDWVVFSNALAVDALLARLFARGGDLRQLGGVRLAAIGAGTADRLRSYHLSADVVPESLDPAAFARLLLAGPRARILLVQGGRGAGAVARALADAGGMVDQVAAYGSRDVAEPDPDVAAALAAGEIGWITVTSSAAARSVARLYGEGLRSARWASIGPLASASIRELGFEVAAEAAPPTTAGLVDAIARWRLAAVAADVPGPPEALPASSGTDRMATAPAHLTPLQEDATTSTPISRRGA